MSGSFSSVWNSFLYNQEEDPSEAYIVVPEDTPIPENEQPVDDLNTHDSLNSNGGIRHRFPLSSDDSRKSSASSAEDELDGTILIFLSGVPSQIRETSDTEKGNNDGRDYIAKTAASNFPDDSQIEAENVRFKSVSVGTDASTCLTGHTTDQSPDSNGEITQSSNEVNSSQRLYTTEEKLRKKLFLLDTTASIFGLVVPILTIGFGAGNIGNCPADFYIPYLVLIMGILNLFTVSYLLLQSTRENFDCWTEFDQDVMFMASYILGFLWIWKDGLFFSMDASFDLSAENYCNHAFYIFNIFLDMFLTLCTIIGYYLFDLNSKKRVTSPTPDDDDDWMIFD